MSGIYGLVRFDGGADEAQARTMLGALSHWAGGRDGGRRVDGVAALGAILRPEEPEGTDAVLPLPDGSTLVATARLDNRDELLAHLRLPATADDRALVAAAWARWGEGACERLYGDWSLAAWEPRERRLFLARDHFGNTALYYHRGPRMVAFASSRKALLALPEVPRRLDELRLAQHLSMWVTDGGATLHDGILRLPPGHRLHATAGALRLDRYWHPESLPELRLRDDREYVDAFVERYDAAVRARLRTSRRVATTLSAGLDSGSVTALAARALAPATDALTAFTAVPAYPEIGAVVPQLLTDEWTLASRVAERSGIADHRRITARSVGTLAAFERSLFLHDEPEFAASNLHWIVGLLDEAREAGAGVLLTGQLGNGGVSWSGDPRRVLRATLDGRWGDAWRAVGELRARHGARLPRALAGQFGRAAVAGARAFAFRRGWSDGPLTRSGLIAPTFARRIGLGDRIRAAGYDYTFAAVLDGRAQQLRILLPDINPVGAIWHEAGAGYGLHILDPTADVRLLELCLQIPDDQFARGAHDRWLMRRAMEGVLPPEVQWNTRRGRQGTDVSFRLRAEREELDAVVDALARSPLVGEYLDVASLRARWQVIRSGAPDAAYGAAPLFARALLFGLFLDRADFRDGTTRLGAPRRAAADGA